MEPVTHEQIAKKIEELLVLLDAANAQALTAKQVNEKQKLSAKVSDLFDKVLPWLVSKPTLYTGLDRDQLTFLKNTYNNAPTLTSSLQNCVAKMEGLRISSGQGIQSKMLKLYRYLDADVKDDLDLKPWHDQFVKLFKRKSNSDNKGNEGDSNNSDNTDNGGNTSNSDSNPPAPTT